MRSCDFVTCHLNPKPRTQQKEREENLRDLPTNQNHRPVLHVLQLADAGVFGLFAFYGSADNVEELLFFAHPAFFAVKAEAWVASAVELKFADCFKGFLVHGLTTVVRAQ